MKSEHHPFGTYFNQDSRVLILGSFPCFNGRDYGDWFYSGSGKNDFWKIISELYGAGLETREQKKRLCRENRIALTDVFSSVTRRNGNCSDSNLRIEEYNKEGIDSCLKSGITRILFTGKFVQRHFFRIFGGISAETKVLPSPSPAANRYIAGTPEYRRMIEKGEVSSVYIYKILIYKKLLYEYTISL